MIDRLYLDDERYPRSSSWVVVRSYQEAIDYVCQFGCPRYISFDHDLGEEKTGYDFAKWLVEKDMDEGIFPKTFNFSVHSANPVGKKNIEQLLKNYLARRK